MEAASAPRRARKSAHRPGHGDTETITRCPESGATVPWWPRFPHNPYWRRRTIVGMKRRLLCPRCSRPVWLVFVADAYDDEGGRCFIGEVRQHNRMA